MDLQQISILLSNPTWDILILFAFVATGFFYGISAGRAKLIAILFSLYISGIVFENFYYIGDLVHGRTLFEEFLFRAFIFVVIIGCLSVLISKVLEDEDSSGKRAWWKALLLSFASTGLLFSYLFHLFPAKEIFTFSPVVQNLFASPSAFFWWLVLPLVALFMARE